MSNFAATFAVGIPFIHESAADEERLVFPCLGGGRVLHN